MSRDYCVGWTHWFNYNPQNVEDLKIILKEFGKSFKNFKPTFANFTWIIKKKADSVYTGRKRIALNSFEDICLELERIKAGKKANWIEVSVYGKTKLLVNEKGQELFHILTMNLKPVIYKTKESLLLKIEIVKPVFFNDSVSAKQNCAEFNKSYKKFREGIPAKVNYFNADSDWSSVKFIPTTKEGYFDLKQANKIDYNQIKEIIEKNKWKKEDFGKWENL